jgi:hypothetical protein
VPAREALHHLVQIETGKHLARPGQHQHDLIVCEEIKIALERIKATGARFKEVGRAG